MRRCKSDSLGESEKPVRSAESDLSSSWGHHGELKLLDCSALGLFEKEVNSEASARSLARNSLVKLVECFGFAKYACLGCQCQCYVECFVILIILQY